MSDVCLVSMPYAAVERPSLALGLLSAQLRGAGLETDCLYPNLWWAEEIGLPLYEVVNASPTFSLLGEWTFASTIVEGTRREDVHYLRSLAAFIAGDSRVRAYLKGRNIARLLARLREDAPAFVQKVAERVLERKPRIVGCTSTFQQHAASLGLLKAIRERDPSVITLMGGANCEGPMGEATRRNFPWVDFVVSGEADESIVGLCRALLEHGRDVPPEVLLTTPGGAVRLDALPTPDYRDYFAALEASRLGPWIEPGIVLESSRGCWWGAKSHCTFCGLNGTAIGYRSKSPERVLEELGEVRERHGIGRVEFADNIIDMRYFEKLLPTLAGAPEPFDIFYETKANLTRKHVEQFAAAGVRYIQPGIESMHDEALKALAKGNRAWMNVQLLKWARELDVYVGWIFLICIPGESDRWYAEMNRWLPWIAHLQPPSSTGNVQYHRFSPYYERAAEFGLTLAPHPAYGHVYRLERSELEDLAYYFIDAGPPRTQNGRLARRPALESLVSWIEEWRRQYWVRSLWSAPPLLDMTDSGTVITIVDTRACAVAERHELVGLEAEVYRRCDAAQSRGLLASLLFIPETTLEVIVDDLKERRLLLDLDGRLLALAVANTPPLADRTFPGGTVDLARHADAAARRSAEWPARSPVA